MPCVDMFQKQFNEMRDNSIEMNVARGEHSEQTGLPPDLIEVLRCAQRVAKELSHPQADSEDKCQTERVTFRVTHGYLSCSVTQWLK